MQRRERDPATDEQPDQEQRDRTEQTTAAAACRHVRRRRSLRVAVPKGRFGGAPARRRGRRRRRERSLNLVDGAYCGPRMLVSALSIGTP